MTKYLAQKLFDYHRERLGMIMMSGTGRVNAIVRNVNHDLLAGVKGCLVGLLSFLNSYPVEGVEADQVILSVAGSSHSGVEIWLVMGVTFLLGFVAGYVTRGWIDEDKPRRRKKTRRPSDDERVNDDTMAENKTLKALREECRRRDLPVTGLKRDLEARLRVS